MLFTTQLDNIFCPCTLNTHDFVPIACNQRYKRGGRCGAWCGVGTRLQMDRWMLWAYRRHSMKPNYRFGSLNLTKLIGHLTLLLRLSALCGGLFKVYFDIWLMIGVKLGISHRWKSICDRSSYTKRERVNMINKNIRGEVLYV